MIVKKVLLEKFNYYFIIMIWIKVTQHIRNRNFFRENYAILISSQISFFLTELCFIINHPLMQYR